MAKRIDDIMRLCCKIAENEEIKVAVRSAVKGGLMTGGAACAGGLLLGPPGFLVGGAAGGLLAWMTSGEFKPLPQILMELPPKQTQLLSEYVSEALRNLDWKDAAQLIALVMGNSALKQRVTMAMLDYVKKELQAEVCYD